uniref:Uncharacterized protein n=1 Tax=Kalanchoe fedtschenkoi TaxID=63787 RepID=A0A7N0T0L6_KALFE
MAESSRANKKRDFAFDGDEADDKRPSQKRVKFPKGKKVTSGDQYVRDVAPAPEYYVPTARVEPHLAAEERAKRRSQLTTNLFAEDRRLPSDIMSQA